jgi:hypothetical protein
MYIRTKSSKNSPRKTVQIVESFLNEKGQPRQRIVQHMGVAFDEEQLRRLCSTAESLIPELQRRAQEEKLFKNGQLPLFVHSPETYEREINDDQTARIKKLLKQEDVLEGPFEVWGEVFDKLGIDDFLGLSDRGRGSTHALRLCLFAKLNDGGSKRRSAWWLTRELGLKLSEARFYRMMDKLAEKISKVKELAFRCGNLLCGNKVSYFYSMLQRFISKVSSMMKTSRSQIMKKMRINVKPQTTRRRKTSPRCVMAFVDMGSVKTGKCKKPRLSWLSLHLRKEYHFGTIFSLATRRNVLR